jgi:hypothetical protein
MGKLKRNAAKFQDAKWTTEEWTTLLAWLDNCIANKLRFEETIETQLKSKWPRGVFNEDRVNRKVKWIWQVKGKNDRDPRKSGEILELGSECLDIDHFEPEEIEALSRAKEALECPASAGDQDERNIPTEATVEVRPSKRTTKPNISVQILIFLKCNNSKPRVLGYPRDGARQAPSLERLQPSKTRQLQSFKPGSLFWRIEKTNFLRFSRIFRSASSKSTA